MSGYNFTDRVRKVLHIAREEAARFNHEYVGTEHILLGIIREGEGVGVAALTNLNIDLGRVRATIESTVKNGNAVRGTGIDIPYTSRAKKALELAMSEARELNHPYVGTEHLLLGVIGEKKGMGALALSDAGVTLEATRSEVRRLVGEAEEATQSQVFSTEADKRFKASVALIELHRTRFGAYPDALSDLQFLSQADRAILTGVRYEKLSEGYALEVFVPPGRKLDLSYPPGFWRGLGLRRTNVARSEEEPTSG